MNEIPSEDALLDTSQGHMSSSNFGSTMSMSSEYPDSPSRQAPPPYRQPPPLPASPLVQPQAAIPPSMTTVGLPILEPTTKVQYKDCVNEFQQAMNNFYDSNRVDVTSRKNSFEQIIEEHQQTPPSLPPRKRSSFDHRSISRENSIEQQMHLMQQQQQPQLPIPYPPIMMEPPQQQQQQRGDENKENIGQSHESNAVTPTSTPAMLSESDENKISVKEAMMKFNRYASEEEAKVPSPLSKAVSKKPEKVSVFCMLRNHKERKKHQRKDDDHVCSILSLSPSPNNNDVIIVTSQLLTFHRTSSLPIL